jgi:hypothetical protein
MFGTIQLPIPLSAAGSFSGGKTAMKWSCLHLHLLPRLEVRGTIPPFPQMPSWRAQGQLDLYIICDATVKCNFNVQLHCDRTCKEARISVHVWTVIKRTCTQSTAAKEFISNAGPTNTEEPTQPGRSCRGQQPIRLDNKEGSLQV